MKAAWKSLLMVSLVALGVACAAKKKGNVPPELEGYDVPEWLTKGSGAFGGDAGVVLYGVGDAKMGNASLAKTTAGNRALSEIGKQFGTYTASLMKDYQSHTDQGGAAESNDQQVEQAIKTFSATNLVGAEVVDVFYGPNNHIWALARLDMKGFKDNLQKINELSAAAKEYVAKKAENMHQDLDKEEEKHGN